jgi:predicted nucleotidyltransferase
MKTLDIQRLLDKITMALEEVPEIVGVVLGGSRARGINRPDSDIDIGIYYDSAVGLDLPRIDSIATEMDDAHRENIITPLGGWGEWVNGGGWLMIDGFHVDFIFRDVRRVAQVIDNCLAGKITTHYHAGHPHAYINVMYLGEIAVCKILTDRNRRLAELKERTTPYPAKMKTSLIDYFMFEAGFSATFAGDNATKDDLYYVAGHLFRAISCLNQVLFAVNEEYCINEKKALKIIEGFAKKPVQYKERVEAIFKLLGSGANGASDACSRLQGLLEDVKVLADEETYLT